MKIFLYLAAFIILFVVYLRLLENKSIFYPSRPILSTPRELGLSFEDVTITTEDRIALHGWLIKRPEARATVIFLHGNAGNIGDRLGKIGMFARMGLNVLIIDYRGYGNSEGHPTEEGIYKDACAAYDYARGREDLNKTKLIGYGASLGGAVAVDLATKRSLDCLILDSTFSSAADMAKRIFPLVPSFLIKTKLDSQAKVKQLTLPKLFIHSVEDTVVPFVLGQKLYDAAPPPKEFIKIKGDHNDGYLYDADKVDQGIRQFLNEHISSNK